MEKNLNADDIKTLIIDDILKYYDNIELIAAEVPYLYGKRKADILLITQGTLVGFEIKSKYDQLSKLLSQTNDYLNVFNLYYIVLSEKFKTSSIIKKIPKRVGIIYIGDNGKVQHYRQALLRKNIDKRFSMLFMWKSDIKKYLNINNLDSIKETRERFMKQYSNNQIFNYSLQALKQRYQYGYQLFLKEKGLFTNVDDLKNLTKIRKTDYLY